MIILIGGTKGGSGKSTICTNLAAYLAGEGKNVCLMDTDIQGSSAKWVERREDPENNPEPLGKVNIVQAVGNVYNSAMDMAKLYEVVLIDAGGHDSRELRTAMVAADKLYVPMQASQLDLETLPKLNDIIMIAMDQNPNLKVFGLLSKAPSNPLISEINEAKELLAQFPLFTLAETIIRERKAYRDVVRVGKGVVEYDNSNAKAEIQLLAQEIFDDE
jgi:chromosome partitioning protein